MFRGGHHGQFLLNTIFDADELEKFMPNKVKKYFAQNNITVYTINATKIAQEIGLGNRTNTILQSAFFRITGVIPVELAVEKMKAAALKSYGAKGQDVVDKNYAAIDRGGEYVQLTVKPEWANLPDDAEKVDDAPAFVKEVVRPINAQAGDLLPVSAFTKFGTVDGSWEVGTAAYEKRGVEAFVPAWKGGATRLPSVSGRVPGQLYPVFLRFSLYHRFCLKENAYLCTYIPQRVQ